VDYSEQLRKLSMLAAVESLMQFAIASDKETCPFILKGVLELDKASQILVIMVFIMGVEHGGSPPKKDQADHRQVDRVTTTEVRHTPVPETAPQQAAEGDGAVPVTVVTRDQLAQLQQQLAEARRDQQILDHQRKLRAARQKRWRDSHLQQARAYESAWKRNRRSGA
jgi:hypothetical protein